MNNKPNYIFVTGGVLSGLGKGVSAAAIGNLLKRKGFKIFVQKLDPYYNTDPGTMSPYQHGEVYVTKDGGETDLDLGHYERFIGEKFTKESNYTHGKILAELLTEEREGKYEGKTVQVVPHVTNKIIEKITLAGKRSKADFIITEIGGTVGDIESQPFIYAISSFMRANEKNTFLIHATYIPYLNASQEFKTKPTQQSISLLQSLSLRPNMLLLRANYNIDEKVVKKVSLTSFLNEKNVIPVPNFDNIYKVPDHFNKYKISEKILKYFNIKNKKLNANDWNKFIKLVDMKKNKVLNVAMIGKYAEFPEAYKSIIEAMKISGIWNKVNIKFKWIISGNLNKSNIINKLKNIDGAMILPGFGKRGFNGKVLATAYLRDKDIPTFGICYGFQAMVVDQAHRKGISDATTSEISKKGTFVIDIIKGIGKNLGGTLRLGETETIHKPGSLISKIYNSDSSFERHRHRYEANPKYIAILEDKDFKFSGYDKKNNLAEVVEIKNKKFFLGIQAHPEFNAQPLKEHPLFRFFVKAMIKHKK